MKAAGESRNRTLFRILILVGLAAALWLLIPRAFRNRQVARTADATRPVMTPAGREELEKFQGRWEFVSLAVDGDPKPEADFKKYTAMFKGDQWIVSEGTTIAAQTTIVLDPAASPKAIDAFPPPGKGVPIHGIYRLEGEKLTIYDRGEDNGERPASFDEEPNAGLVMIVFKRPHH